MAAMWFQVETTLVGSPKIRRLHYKLHCPECEAIGIVIVLWDWAVKGNADEYGRILDATKDDIEKALFYRNSQESKIEYGTIVDSLVETGWLDYVDGNYFLHDWQDHQGELYKLRKHREKEAERKRAYRSRGFQQQNGEQDDDIPQESPSESPQNTTDDADEKPAKPDNSNYAPKFEEFWSVYPRKIGKGEAYRKYQTRRKDGFSDDELISAAKNYDLQCKKQKTERQFIKHPKTFLSDTLPFLDFLPEKLVPNGKKEEVQTGNPFKNWEGDEQ